MHPDRDLWLGQPCPSSILLAIKRNLPTTTVQAAAEAVSRRMGLYHMSFSLGSALEREALPCWLD
jgi:hypothetical protein